MKYFVILNILSVYEIQTLYHPLYSGRKFNVQKTFRRHPAHLLNVFCTSILHVVSTGQISHIITRPPLPPNPQLRFAFQISLLLLSEFKGSLSGLRQYLTTGSPLKMMKNAFYYVLKTLFDHVGRRIDKNTKVIFEIYDVTRWAVNNYNIHIAQYLKKYRQIRILNLVT